MPNTSTIWKATIFHAMDQLDSLDGESRRFGVYMTTACLSVFIYKTFRSRHSSAAAYYSPILFGYSVWTLFLFMNVMLYSFFTSDWTWPSLNELFARLDTESVIFGLVMAATAIFLHFFFGEVRVGPRNGVKIDKKTKLRDATIAEKLDEQKDVLGDWTLETDPSKTHTRAMSWDDCFEVSPPRGHDCLHVVVCLLLLLWSLTSPAKILIEHFLVTNYMVHYNEGKYGNISNMFRGKGQRVAIIFFLCVSPLTTRDLDGMSLILRVLIFTLETDNKSGKWQHMVCVILYASLRATRMTTYDLVSLFFAMIFMYYDRQCSGVLNGRRETLARNEPTDIHKPFTLYGKVKMYHNACNYTDMRLFCDLSLLCELQLLSEGDSISFSGDLTKSAKYLWFVVFFYLKHALYSIAAVLQLFLCLVAVCCFFAIVALIVCFFYRRRRF